MLITLEGPEGAGKSTLQGSIAERLRASGRSVVCTREPGGTILGVEIRRLLLDSSDVSPRAELMLFLADRAHHVEEVIRPGIEEGSIVVCDRFIDSTIVYQGYARGLDLSMLRSANKWATGGLAPDLTILLDIEPRIGLSRVSEKDRLDSEPIEFHERVRAGFLDEAAIDPDRIVVIDGGQEQSLVAERAWDAVRRRVEDRLGGMPESLR